MIASGMTDKLFGGVIVILVGDFLQMPVVQGVSLYDALYIRVYAEQRAGKCKEQQKLLEAMRVLQSGIRKEILLGRFGLRRFKV